MMKTWQKSLLVASILTASAFTILGCGGAKEGAKSETPKKQIVTDVVGNKVEVPANIKKLAVIPMPWASVVYCLDGGSSERMVAIHPGTKGAYKGKFLETKDKHFGEINTKLINQNFSFNMEGLAQAGVEAALLWKYQEADGKKLKDIGIAPVLIYNDTVDNLKKSFLAVGKLLGKEQKAQELNKYYDDAYSSILAHKDEVAKAQKPRILFLRNAKLRLQGNDHFMHEAIKIGGGDNPISKAALDKANKEISMEEVYKINPDIIFLSNFDKFVPDDLYNNKLPGQDWSTVKAVKEKRVYKVPLGIYRWDAPGVETPLMMRWLAHMMQPEIFKEVNIRKETRDFYKKFMGFEVTDAELAKIFADEVNKNSVPVK